MTKEQKELQELIAKLNDLSNGKIKASKIVGGGHKDNKKIAYQYLSEKIQEYFNLITA